MTKSRSIAQQEYRQRKRLLDDEHLQRRIKIINNTIGEYRLFSGSVVIENFAEEKLHTDADHLHDIQGWCDNGRAVAYWADGSLRNDGVTTSVLGAGVAWQEEEGGEWEWKSRSFGLGADTGSTNDAELFALAAALELAVKRVKQVEKIELVRVFTDSMSVLEGTRDGKISLLGPAVSSPWALQTLYDQADILSECDIRVELVWVKGHAKSKGNQRADGAAAAAAESQKGTKRDGRFVKKKDVPELIAKMGPDSVEE